jgi:hypothetical protein
MYVLRESKPTNFIKVIAHIFVKNHTGHLRRCININAKDRLKNDDFTRQRAEMAALPEPM